MLENQENESPEQVPNTLDAELEQLYKELFALYWSNQPQRLDVYLENIKSIREQIQQAKINPESSLYKLQTGYKKTLSTAIQGLILRYTHPSSHINRSVQLAIIKDVFQLALKKLS